MIRTELNLCESIEVTAAATPEAFPNLVKHLDPLWIEEALANTGTATLRRRRLPMDRVVWLVLGMAVLRDMPIAEVARQLELALPSQDGSVTVAPSALAQARARLGPDPMEWLFARTGAAWATPMADADRWRGLALYGVDGTTLRVADSEENRQFFGSQNAGGERGVSGYPLVRMVVLMALRSHVLAAVEFGPYSDERAYARPLWSAVPDESLVLIDRLYLQANILVPLMSMGTNRHWLTRAKSTTKYTVLERLGPGDELVEFAVSSSARQQDPSLPATFQARAVRYQRKGYKPQVLLTSLTDAKRYPAEELRAVYHVRWELELGFALFAHLGEPSTSYLHDA